MIKPINNLQSPKVLVNELIGCDLLQLLGLAHPEGACIGDIPADIGPLVDYPGGGGVQGPAFCSLLIDPSYDYAEELVDKIEDPCMLAGVIVADTWVINRDVRQMRLVLTGKPDTYRPVFIDQGHYFGTPDWDEASLKASAAESTVRGLWAREHDPKWEWFQPALEKLGQVTRDDLEWATDDIPSEWPFTFSERKALCAYLLRRAKIVPTIIEEKFN